MFDPQKYSTKAASGGVLAGMTVTRNGNTQHADSTRQNEKRQSPNTKIAAVRTVEGCRSALFLESAVRSYRLIFCGSQPIIVNLTQHGLAIRLLGLVE